MDWLHQYKEKYIDTGSIKPLSDTMIALFFFSYAVAWPQVSNRGRLGCMVYYTIAQYAMLTVPHAHAGVQAHEAGGAGEVGGQGGALISMFGGQCRCFQLFRLT